MKANKKEMDLMEKSRQAEKGKSQRLTHRAGRGRGGARRREGLGAAAGGGALARGRMT